MMEISIASPPETKDKCTMWSSYSYMTPKPLPEDLEVGVLQEYLLISVYWRTSYNS